MKIAFLTLGCKVNSYETENMKKDFENAGYQVVSFSEQADVYVVNTCTVTNIADRKSRKMLHRAKRMNPAALVVAAGCYVDSAKRKGEKDEQVDLFIQNEAKENFVSVVEEMLRERGIWREEKESVEMSDTAKEEEHTRICIKVQNGCNQYCTYCIIPYVRGPLTSTPIEKVKKEVNAAAQKGCQEVVITGIHLSSYGVDFTDAKNFLALEGKPLLQLLKEISEIDGIERIRLGSLEPRIITEEFTRKLAEIKEICPHFHLSLQSGCNATLKRMNRHYTAEQYLEKVEILRKYFEHPAITTDIIVGFPQEDEEEFQTTCAFAKEVGFAQIHVFKYSRRNGTIADGMTGQVMEAVKAERSEKLITIEKELEEKYKNYFLDREEEVLLEEMEQIDGKEYYTGYNERYVRFAIPAESDMQDRCNTIATVKVTGEIKEGSYLTGTWC